MKRPRLCGYSMGFVHMPREKIRQPLNSTRKTLLSRTKKILHAKRSQKSKM